MPAELERTSSTAPTPPIYTVESAKTVGRISSSGWVVARGSLGWIHTGFALIAFSDFSPITSATGPQRASR